MSALGADAVRVEAWPDWASWQATRQAEDERFNEDYRARLAAIAEAARQGWAARCTACGDVGLFKVPGDAAADDEAHREHLACPHCRLNGRSRAALAVVDREGLPAKSVAWTPEHGSAAWRHLVHRFPAATGSEFMPARRGPLRRIVHALRFGATPHRDLRATGFASSSHHLVLCLDVFEHVEGVDQALAECSRILRPGGLLVATMPFDEKASNDRQLARTDGSGSIVWDGDEEWHDDPLGTRVACFHRFGWALAGRALAAGFAEAEWCRVDAPAAALFGLWVFRARR